MSPRKRRPNPSKQVESRGLPALPPTRYPLERVHNRRKLIHELAQGEIPRIKLAEKYGVVHSAITQFAQRHAAQIEQVQSEIEDDLRGLWVAQKSARLEELQGDIEAIGQPEGKPEERATLLRVKHSALRNVAEEMGQLPARQITQGSNVSVNVAIVGVDLEQL